ncbi:MAG: hypothetical protein Q7J54_06135 [Candidatus Woesearchaeota archaeon]|nr:hypothetical protein [Candidatus Woesearchaeota archaeon]
MMIPALEERLEGFDYLRPALLSELEKERINFADRSNWNLLPKESGGQRGNVRSWKYAWSDKIINYFSEIDAPLSDEFATNLYTALNKDVMKKVVYGILSIPEIPSDIYNSLTDWEKLCFAAGTYSKRSVDDVRDKSLPEIVHSFVKRGYDYLHRTHAIKRAKGEYETILKIPGSQNYRIREKKETRCKEKQIVFEY